MNKFAAMVFALLISAFLLVPNVILAATWFSCDGSSLCGSSVSEYWGKVGIGTQSDSPTGKSGVWMWTLPAGMPGGEGVGNIWLPGVVPSGATEMWVQWYWKYSSGYAYNGIVNKQMYFDPSNTMGMGIIWDIGISMGPQGPNATVYWPNLGAKVSNDPLWYVNQTGVWHKFKARYKMNDNGKYNGVFQAWVDDVMVTNRTDVYYSNGLTLSTPYFALIYGGASGDVPKLQYQYIAGVYLGSTDPGGSSTSVKIPGVPTKLTIN